MISWDENKRISNLKKHNIDFADCLELWDSLTLTKEDCRMDYGEQRFITLGVIKVGVVLVVHTENIDGEIRIISARKATKYERKYYLSQQ